MADNYFGSSTPDFGAQYTQRGGPSSQPSIMNVSAGLTYITPAGGITITELQIGMEAAPGQSGVTVVLGVYDITSGVTNAPLLGQATVNSLFDNSGYVWHTVSGLSINVPQNRTIAVASAPPSAPVWTTRSVEGQSYHTPGTSQTSLSANWPGSGSGREIPLRAGYSLNVVPPTLLNINGTDVVRVGSNNNTISTAGIATLTSLTVGGKAATGLSAPNGDGTFNLPGFTDEQVYSLMGTVSAVASDSTLSDDKTVTLLPPLGWTYVTLAGTLNTSNTGILFNYVPSAVAGDQIVFQSGNVIVDAAGNIWTDTDATLWHIRASTGMVRSVAVTVGVSGSDTNPNPFTFTDQTSVPLNSLRTSNTVTITGIDAPSTVSITGSGQYSKNGGAYTSSNGSVVSGDTLTVQLQSSALNSTTTSTTLSVGAVSDTFSVTTVAAGDNTPNAFSFTAQSGVTINTRVNSNSITISGVDAGTSVTVSGGEYSKNGGAYTTSATTCQNGDTFTVGRNSSGSFSTTVSVSLTVGTFTAAFNITTEAQDTVPDSFAPGSVSGANVSTVYESQEFTVTGVNSNPTVTIVNGEYAVNTGSGFGAFTSTSTNVPPGAIIKMRRQSSASFSTAVTSTITIGTVQGVFTITTRAETVSAEPKPMVSPLFKEIVRAIRRAVRRSIRR